MEFNVKVEYETKPIRHIAVQCPACSKWFNGREITDLTINDITDVYDAVFACPICGQVFGEFDDRDHAIVEESRYPDIYNDCLKKSVIWK